MPTMNYDADSYDDITTALESRISFLRDNPAAPNSGSVIQRVKLLESLVNDLRENGRGYEGWSNWETWHVRLLAMNDERLYDCAMLAGSVARERVDAKDISSYEWTLMNLRDSLRDSWIDTVRYGRDSWGDEYKPALVNWVELLESFMDMARENDAYENEKAKAG